MKDLKNSGENLEVFPQDNDEEGAYGLPPVLTVSEAAKFLRLNKKSVYAAISVGEMPGKKIGNRTIIFRDAMLKWLISQGHVLPSRKRKKR